MSELKYGTWRTIGMKIASLAATGLIGILIAAANASGQAVIDQYVPQGNPAASGGTAAGGASDTLGPTATPQGREIATQPPKGSSAGGDVPFTDYPVTPFVWIVVAVLVAGALVRVAAPILARRRAGSTG